MRWNPLTPLAPAREDLDTPEIVEHSARFGGRPAYTSEIAGLIATICKHEFGWCTGSIISANDGLSFSIRSIYKEYIHCPKICQDEGFKYILSRVLVTSEYVYLT